MIERGWYKPAMSRWQHYFVGWGPSLCGRYSKIRKTKGQLSLDNPGRMEGCTRCRQMAASRAGAAYFRRRA